MWLRFQHCEAAGLGEVEWQHHPEIIEPAGRQRDEASAIVASIVREFVDNDKYRGVRNVEWHSHPPPYVLEPRVAHLIRVYQSAEREIELLEKQRKDVENGDREPCPGCDDQTCAARGEEKPDATAYLRSCTVCGLPEARWVTVLRDKPHIILNEPRVLAVPIGEGAARRIGSGYPKGGVG